MSEQRVYIVMCKCPLGHCILGASYEGVGTDEEKAAAVDRIQTDIQSLVSRGIFNPFCGICSAPLKHCSYTVGRTRYRTTEEAMPELKKIERENASAAAYFAHQKKKAAQN
jgi:hypothetical protein